MVWGKEGRRRQTCCHSREFTHLLLTNDAGNWT